MVSEHLTRYPKAYQVDHIHPEPIHAALQPPQHDLLVHRLSHRWRLPIEIRLFFAVQTGCQQSSYTLDVLEVIFLSRLVPFPCAAIRKLLSPVIWRLPFPILIVFRRTPDVEVSEWIVL